MPGRLPALVGLCLVASASRADDNPVTPLRHAHAHNDYEHKRPLLDALDQGFCSVEADIYLIDGELLVAHDRKDAKPGRTLQSLYLDPIRQLVKANGGRVHPGEPVFHLLIDVKTGAEDTYRALDRVLAGYADLVSVTRAGKFDRKAVTVVLSGNRAKETIARQPVRYVGIDGRPEDLDSDAAADLLPWVSGNWALLFRWRGDGPMPAAERAKLRELVGKAHARNRLVRFWATPEKAAVWAELRAAGVDLINTDRLADLRAFLTASPDQPAGPGVFAGSADIGTVRHPGSVKFDPAANTYTVTGSGANMWFATDAFHFAWATAAGDVALTADIAFVGAGKDPHRKACLMIRQGLDPDTAYVDVAVHGDGLTSLQFRDAKGANTHEVQANVTAPARVRLVRRGKYALLYTAAKGEELRFSGAAVRVNFDGPVHVGIGVCAHNPDVTETAVFANLELTSPLPPAAGKPVLYSTLETQAMNSTDRRVVFVTPGRIEAPNWLRDGKTLVYNSGGRLYRVPATGGKPAVIDTGFAVRCNNDHGVSPDGTQLVISDQSQPDRKSRIYTLPVAGGTPTLVTPAGPSYWHGWSPDGRTLAYCAERNGEFDIYTVPVGGGPETRLTTAKGLDDGPEYSPDGKHIYFNSDRTGRMHVWRMNADGSEQQQITADGFNNWFPHPSPDGRALVFLSYEADVKGHPENKDVTLRRMTLADRKVDVLGRFFGGQGTVNVPCWSPDGRRIAFVTYQLVP